MTTPDPGEAPAPADPVAAAETRLPTDAERRLHPWSWLFVLLGSLRQFVLPALVLLILGGRGDERAQLLIAMVLVALLAIGAVWRYFTYRYRIDADSLLVRSGVFQRELRQVPFSRIHNVALHQSLLHRLFGVAEVKLESAGGTRPEAQMRVLKLADALALERLIRHRGRAGDADAPAAAHDDEDTAGRTLLSLPLAEIVRLGLISNRGMVVVTGAFAVAWQVFPEERLAGLVRGIGHEAFGYVGHFATGSLAKVLVVAGVVLVMLVLVRLLSVLLAVVRYHGFRLSEHGRRLTVERGLLTRLRGSVPRRRIQAWTLHEGALHRLFRRRSLEIDTAASQGDAQHEKSLRELAPVATAEACDALVRHVLRDGAWPPVAWSPLHRAAWWRLLLSDLAFGAVLLVAGLWFFGGWGLLALLWLPWAWVVARGHAARAGYAFDGHLVAVREGWWSRRWRFAELDKVQALELRRSPLDRRCGMASVWLDTAGAGQLSPTLRIRYLPLDEARALFARLSREVARRRLSW